MAAINAQIQPLPEGGILYDPARVRKPSADLFERGYWAARGTLRQMTGGRGSVSFIEPGDHSAPADSWVLRHYLRGGLIARVLEDRYLWAGEEQTRSFSEWRLLAILRDRGLPVPAPVAARYVRSGLLYRADLITAELPASHTLAQMLRQGSLSEQQWQCIGRTVARFHASEVHHADLNAHNILLGANDAVFVLDFDRGRLQTRGRWEAQVLARLKRSIEKIATQRGAPFDENDWRSFISGYGSAEFA